MPILQNDKPIHWGDLADTKSHPHREFTVEELRSIPFRQKYSRFDREPIKTGFWEWRDRGVCNQAVFYEYTGGATAKEFDMGGTYIQYDIEPFWVYVDGKPLLGFGDTIEDIFDV